ncbi:MAG: uroporphyrinogen-III synthase [Xanthobacteraceae bacterium]
MRLLILRPQPDAARTAAALRAQGHDPVVAPLLRTESLAKPDLSRGPWDAFLITSVNSLSSLADYTHRAEVRSVPVFTVGERTADEIRKCGFVSVTSADSDVTGLVNLVADRLKPPARLLYLAGEEHSGDLGGDLRAKGFAVDTVVVYRAVVAERLPQEATDALAAGLDGVLHYSRRSAKAYLDAAGRAGMLAIAIGPTQFCLSARIAEPLASAGAARIKVAPRPNEAALLELID